MRASLRRLERAAGACRHGLGYLRSLNAEKEERAWCFERVPNALDRKVAPRWVREIGGGLVDLLQEAATSDR